MGKIWKVSIGIAVLLILFVYANNTSRLSHSGSGFPTVLLHRGMAQQVDWDSVAADTCIAAQIAPPEHDYIENTIASMLAAFDRGADVVEIDVTATADDQFAVFHDRILDCRTDGRGLTREHSLEQLKALDIGYGYTADGGRTFPFRGKGRGLMPSMAEVFETFPNRAFLVDIKGNVPSDGTLLADHLSRLTPAARSRLIVFGRAGVLERLRDQLPDIRTFSVGSIANCLVRYMAYGWTGLVPGACDNATLFVPVNIAPWLWGWPDLFMDRIKARSGSIVLVGPFRGGSFSAGMDTVEDLARLPEGYDGGIWTNDLELVTAAIKRPDNRKQDSGLR